MTDNRYVNFFGYDRVKVLRSTAAVDFLIIKSEMSNYLMIITLEFQ